MHKVYLENRCVVFCSPSELPSDIDGNIVIRDCSISELESIADTLKAGNPVSDTYVLCDDADKMLAGFSSFFREITAGGGVVCRNGQYLMIFRRGLWDLPKGKLEDGESIEECALREVEEETGLSDIESGSRICTTHHIYKLDGVFCLKHTHWFSMRYNGSGTPSPQVEEEITKAEWMSFDAMTEKSASSYRSIREVIANL